MYKRQALEQLIVHSQPTQAVAVFDDEDRAHGWRHQRLPEYKAGRAPMPDTLVAEMPALRAAFEQRGIRCWASPGSEADDLAATLAVKVAQAGHQATIVSTDKGYCQPVSYTHLDVYKRQASPGATPRRTAPTDPGH